MEKINGVNYSLQEAVKSRRKRVINRLESQLSSGIKSKGPDYDNVPLTEQDRNRIKKEIDILKARIN